MKHSTSRDGVKKKPETVAERAVRGYLAGYIYSERNIDELFETEDYSTRRPTGVLAVVSIRIPQRSINDMLRRERAQAKKQSPKASKPKKASVKRG